MIRVSVMYQSFASGYAIIGERLKAALEGENIAGYRLAELPYAVAG